MSDPLRVLDLFSGIGGFSLGLERTGGFKTVAFCEIEEFPRSVLRKHWPGIPIYEDVRTLNADALARDGISIDAICGGFPCQDISSAGLGAGIDGERSGLWADYARLIGELRPRYVIVENVSALLGRGMGRVLGDLASIGYDAEWHSIPASAVGAPHIRDRVWIVAHPAPQRPAEAWGDSKRSAQRPRRRAPVLADATSSEARSTQSTHGLAAVEGQRTFIVSSLGGRDGVFRDGDWDSEPDVCRVADGISINVDRVGALGNAVVPQIPELIGYAILAGTDIKSATNPTEPKEVMGMTNAEVTAISAELTAAEAALRMNDLQNVCTNPAERTQQLEERALVKARHRAARDRYDAMIARLSTQSPEAEGE